MKNIFASISKAWKKFTRSEDTLADVPPAPSPFPAEIILDPAPTAPIKKARAYKPKAKSKKHSKKRGK